MTYSDALSFLGDARRFGMKLGLETMREMARALGDPQNNLRFIHIAGTNGKGSTAAFCESCLHAAGYRVGLYTSPHLVSIRERIQINRQLISQADFAEGMEDVRRASEATKQTATYFEIMTALALRHFAREKVDWVVWETGLGGRFDATNIVRPEACIITNIGLEHQQYLGETLREIAMEKAGIIKPGVPVVSAAESGEALDVIREQALEKNCVLTSVSHDMKVRGLGFREGKQIAQIAGHEWTLGLIGPHQIGNAACAIGALRQLQITDEAIQRGLSDAIWPGRFEILSEKPLIVLDGAHNAAGMRKLIETWQEFLRARFGWSTEECRARAHLVFASVSDKDVSEMAQLLLPWTRQMTVARLANERSADPAQIAPAFAPLPCRLVNSVADVWQSIGHADSDIPILVTGSLFLVGEMLAQRHGTTEEYRLNERLETSTTTR